MNFSPPSPLALRLSAVLLPLRGCLGGWQLRGLLSTAVVYLLFSRLGSVLVRFERLAARFAAGETRREAARVPAAVAVAQVVAEAAARPARVWPTRFGWLVQAAGWQAMGYSSQLRALLETPEMVALLTACPQAVRVLRPLCRALRIETAVLRPGVPVVVRAPRPVRPRVKRPPVDWGRIPLPRGVLTAARRDRRKNDF